MSSKYSTNCQQMLFFHKGCYLCSVSDKKKNHGSRQFLKSALIFLSLALSYVHTHSTQMLPDPTLLLSLVAWHKGDLSFPTLHQERGKIKRTQRAVSQFNGEKTRSVTSAILGEITVGDSQAMLPLHQSTDSSSVIVWLCVCVMKPPLLEMSTSTRKNLLCLHVNQF